MNILNSTPEDIDTLFNLYDAAIVHQKAVSHLHWLPFERSRVEAEIAEGRQWKILIDGQIACIFLSAYTDPDIWGAEAEPAVYLHRIVTHPDFRGRNFVQKIVDWAIQHAQTRGIKYVRLDTWSENLRLRDLYLACGFRFHRVVTPTNFSALPSHYVGVALSLFELEID